MTSHLLETSRLPDLDRMPSQESAANEPSGPPLVSLDSPIFREVSVELTAKLGQMSLPISDLLALQAGSVVKLGIRLNELVELKLGHSVVARGEIVAVGDNFGIRIVEVAHLS